MPDLISSSQARKGVISLIEQPDQRPWVKMGTELHDNVDSAVKALRTDRELFQRDGQLVHVIRTAEAEADRAVAAGTPQIRDVPLPQLTERLTRVARFSVFDKRSDQWMPRLPSKPIVGAVSTRGQWEGIPPLLGVLEHPAMREDGSLIQDPGYDPSTGYLYLPSVRFPPVSQRPSQGEANEALLVLSEPFLDFPFQDGSSRNAALAVILTLLARPAIQGCAPAVLFDANVRGAGKSLCTDVISTIATGRPTAKMSYPPDAIELEKILAGYAIRGAVLINFDNITNTFGGGPLDRVLTAADRVELRVLGRSEVPALRWRAVVVGTGNNIVLSGDTSRRVLLARMESDLERPEERTGFRHPQLIRWLQERRPELVRAALTVLRAYVVAGRPGMDIRPWGSFEAWAELVPAALVHAGGEDPSTTRPTSDDHADPETAALESILTLLPQLGDATAKTIVQTLYTRERMRGEAAPDGYDELREAIEILAAPKPNQPPCHRRLGNRLRGFRKRVLGGKRLNLVRRKGINYWTVEVLDGGM